MTHTWRRDTSAGTPTATHAHHLLEGLMAKGSAAPLPAGLGVWPAALSYCVESYELTLYGNAIPQLKAAFFNGSSEAAW